jgi:hypothetical protein
MPMIFRPATAEPVISKFVDRRAARSRYFSV